MLVCVDSLTWRPKCVTKWADRLLSWARHGLERDGLGGRSRQSSGRRLESSCDTLDLAGNKSKYYKTYSYFDLGFSCGILWFRIPWIKRSRICGVNSLLPRIPYTTFLKMSSTITATLEVDCVSNIYWVSHMTVIWTIKDYLSYWL